MPEQGSNQNALGAGMNTQISHSSGYSALKMRALSRLEETSRNLTYTPLSEQSHLSEKSARCSIHNILDNTKVWGE